MSARIEDEAPADGWRPEGQYRLVHPSGRSIGRYIVNCVETYMLWHRNEHRGASARPTRRSASTSICVPGHRRCRPGNDR